MASLLLIAAAWIGLGTARRLNRHPERRESIGQRYSNARAYLFFANLIGFAVCLIGLGWGWAAVRLAIIEFDGRQVLIPGGEMLILAPYLVAQIGSWFFFYSADRKFHELVVDQRKHGRFWTRGGYVLFLLRQQFIMVFAPLFLLMAQQGVERLYPEIMQEAWLPFASLFVLPAFLILFPLLLPSLLGLRPLPAGPVRERLKANARRLRFRYAQIYLWDTRGAVANAMVVGVVPWIRYVVFTDRLLEEMTNSEVDAVFGHEVGHARHGHILYYALFLILSFVLMGALVQAVRLLDESHYRDYPTLFLIAPVALMGSYMFAVFGFISRRCERQADIFGCRAGSCALQQCPGHDENTVLVEGGAGLCTTGIDEFIRALRRVEDVNGMARVKPPWRGAGVIGKLDWIFRLLTGWLHTWQHSTIPKRIAFLESIARDPSIERRFQKRVFVLKWLIALGLIGTLLGLAAWKGWSVLLLAM